MTVAWGDSSAATVFTEATAGAITDKTHTYADDGTFTVTITVEEENGAGPGSDYGTFQVVVANVAPTVAKPTFQPVLIACQTMTTLTGISFSDPGVNDNPWTVDIDWGDGVRAHDLRDGHAGRTAEPEPHVLDSRARIPPP